MERCSVFLDVDIIDHLTKASRDGKGFDKRRAVELIRSYNEYYGLENAGLSVDPVYVTEEADEKELYDSLIAVREHIMKKLFK